MANLCGRAAGLFVYAVAIVNFVGRPTANPKRQLDRLLGPPESSVREAETKFNENTTLNSLYASILLRAFGDEGHSDFDSRVRSVLGAAVLAADPLSPSTIAILLGLDVLKDVLPLLSSVRSLFIFREDINSPVRPFHKSFHHFIIDLARCTNKRFLIFPPTHHSELLIACLNLMNRTLERNMCKLPDQVPNSDVRDLKERVEQYIDPALRYACRLWHTHLVGGYTTLFDAAEITSDLHRFLETKLWFWLEVLGALGAVGNAADALQAVVDRLEVRLHSILSFLPGYAQS